MLFPVFCWGFLLENSPVSSQPDNLHKMPFYAASNLKDSLFTLFFTKAANWAGMFSQTWLKWLIPQQNSQILNFNNNNNLLCMSNILSLLLTSINNLLEVRAANSDNAFNRLSACTRLHDRPMKKINTINSAASGRREQWACRWSMMRKINCICGEWNGRLTLFKLREMS